MNNPFCQRYLVAILLLLSSISPFSTFAKGESTATDMAGELALPSGQELHTLYQETLEQYYSTVVIQLNAIDVLLQDLAFNLANNQSITARNKPQAINKIRELRGFINELKETRFVVLNERLISSLIAITGTTISHITEGLRNGLDTLEPLDINRVNIPDQENITTIELEQQLANNVQQMQALEKISNNLGLHWYNKLYRLFKRDVVSPAKKTAFPAFCATALTASTFCLWYYFGGENPKWLRDKVGYPALSDLSIGGAQQQNNFLSPAHEVIHYGEEILKTQDLIDKANINQQEEILKGARSALTLLQEQFGRALNQIDKPMPQANKTGWFGRAEQIIFRFKEGRYSVGLGMLGIGGWVLNNFFPTLGASVGKKLKAADNFMMGGAYKNRQVDDITYSSNVTFESLIGQDDAKEYGRELCQYLKNPEFFDRTKMAPRTGILLFGDTRTGKSYFISALFGEIKKTLGASSEFKLWKVSSESIIKFGIQAVMDEARRDAPCIVVIEEIDLLGLQRVNNASRLSEFMTAMSSCLQENTLDKTVIIVGTTNKLENLEPALRTDGRFGKHILFDYPKFDERRLYIERELTKTACLLDYFEIDKLARETEGCSYEKLALFIKRAFLRAKLYGEPVSQEALEQSIDENIRGISCASIAMTDVQKELIATHLAGHAVASILLDPHAKVSKITLKDVASKIEEEIAFARIFQKNEKELVKQAPVEHGKIFVNHDHDMLGIEDRDEKIKQCKICLAGHVAERLLLGSCGYGYHAQDKQTALNIAKSIACEGININELPDHIKNTYFDAAFKLLVTCEQEVTELLSANRAQLQAIIAELKNKHTLSARHLHATILGEQSEIEELDASKLLALLLKNQAIDVSLLECSADGHLENLPAEPVNLSVA